MSSAGEPSAARAVLDRTGISLERLTAVRAAVIAGLLVFVLFALPALLSAYWIKVLTDAAIFSVVALGLNLLFGRVGLVSDRGDGPDGAREII